MTIRINKKEISLDSLIVMLLIIVTLSLHNSKIILASMQVICSSIIYISRIREGKLKKHELLYFLWLLSFTLWGTLSVMWATHSTYNVLRTLITLFQELMVGLAIVIYLDSQEKVGNIYYFLFIASIILVGRMIILVPNSAWGTERVGPYIGYGVNGVSMVLSYSSLFAFDLFQNTKKRKYLFLTVLFTVFSFLCGSKKALLITIIGIAMLMVLKSKNIFQTIKRSFEAIFIVSILVYLVMNIEGLYNVLGRRIERMILALTDQSGGDMSTKDRMLFASSAFQVFLSHPILGVGLDNYRFYNYMTFYAHNNYAEIAADLGIVGLLIYYSLPFTLLINSFKRFKNRVFIFIAIFVFVILAMDVAIVSFESDYIGLYLAVVYGIYNVYKNKEGDT